ncbi:4Fe-4S binding protein [Parasporobacterium paucivorans]|uniref:Pyruvate ferredoxin oxidoreductase delta subunit n=1 Tax=Parasporobacterium paucivorans DSM 15970 TaxID=1122934 RepID=A0A1M6D664_9FIRM|nr:4Fe-4S binding protein [Parasporobacterium paucivorans]SHI68707.1 pyruvate ferredoxin oxidoreductase delta subunit [Parasporobacterium paucivorans DSM 15970]
MRTDVTKITETSPYAELTEGLKIYAGGTSKKFHTGEWRTSRPIMNWEKCKQCLLCAPVCPDSSIPVADGKRGNFEMDYCKGCGICASVCPFGAIEMKEGQ